MSCDTRACNVILDCYARLRPAHCLSIIASRVRRCESAITTTHNTTRVTRPTNIKGLFTYAAATTATATVRQQQQQQQRHVRASSSSGIKQQDLHECYAQAHGQLATVRRTVCCPLHSNPNAVVTPTKFMMQATQPQHPRRLAHHLGSIHLARCR
jgi:hypothetical protein